MTETAQPAMAAESEVASDPMTDAANAFKVTLGQAPERLRDDHGRFASTQEIEAEEEAQAEPEAESHDEVETDEAAEEAQPEAVDLPTSWPAEHAETWKSLSPETQALIVEREGQRDAAVNAKFQEAANVRKANEAVITEANQSRQKFVEAADYVLSMVQPTRPPHSMLIQGSHDYNPDRYHLLNAEADHAESLISSVKQHRTDAIAQLSQEQEAKALEEITQIESKARPALLKDVPELTDPQKQASMLGAIVQYAVESGIPAEVFQDPEQAKYVTSAQLHMAWKAQQYDKMKAAQGKVVPKAAKPSAPVVRPGVATSANQQKSIQRKNIQDRLTREGSVAAGADFFKSIKW